MTDAVLHGEPINSYAWMTWVQEFRPVRHSAEDFADAISSSLLKLGVGKVGVVGRDNLPMSIWEEMSPRVRARCIDFWFEYTSVKSIRSAREVALLREVGGITAHAMKAAVEAISVGKTESEIAAVANYTMSSEGGHGRRLPHHSQLRPQVRAQAQLPDGEEDGARGHGLS